MHRNKIHALVTTCLKSNSLTERQFERIHALL